MRVNNQFHHKLKQNQMSTVSKKSGVQAQSYAALLAKSDNQRAEDKIAYLVESAKHSLGQAISNTKYELSQAKNSRLSLISSESINWKSIAGKDDEIEGLQKGLERLNGYASELFPEGLS